MTRRPTPSDAVLVDDSAPEAFGVRVSRQAPRWLDKKGQPLTPDPLAAAWTEMTEAFSRLHGQRLVELMTHLFAQMPAGESVALNWFHDESSCFYLEFSNGWRLTDETQSVRDQPWWDSRSTQEAPNWFPRSKQGLNQWKRWHNLLHCYSISSEVDGLAQERLHDLSEALGGLQAKDLPRIREVLTGERWQALAQQGVLDAALPASPPSRKKTPRF